jgi:hypothetical protein
MTGSQPDIIEMRRSQRVALRIPIQVRWTPPGEPPIVEDATTLVVSAHGALIFVAMKVKTGSRIFARNQQAQEKECRVVHTRESRERKHEVGVAFLVPGGKFWGLEFPPADWTRENERGSHPED